MAKSKSTAEKAKVQTSKGQRDNYADLNDRMANGSSMVPPVLLTGQARRHHVRAVRALHTARCAETAHTPRPWRSSRAFCSDR